MKIKSFEKNNFFSVFQYLARLDEKVQGVLTVFNVPCSVSSAKLGQLDLSLYNIMFSSLSSNNIHIL